MQGNYIKYIYSENEYSEVVGFDSENIYLNHITHDFVMFEDCEPIPITEEWLLNFGFRNINTYNDYHVYVSPDNDYHLQIDVRINNGEYIILDNSVKDLSDFALIPIKYVHQLQNLYFALTGKQLTIKSEQ